ncbi:hypothetical protein TW95_gp1758 [Pandoravirus inopinatum]|uniref:Uncharacterized protein n=1 Tax=Pandoravirus inopinatum TaxID=1605721 RepID=A0A0B5JF70_9VIRU|nr:hypothetical protein TW95_gp1758 [Pandoravirus inopinatum]AJF98492.1 hypothetical protein [Pandoravirus inopinatum]
MARVAWPNSCAIAQSLFLSWFYFFRPFPRRRPLRSHAPPARCCWVLNFSFFIFRISRFKNLPLVWGVTPSPHFFCSHATRSRQKAQAAPTLLACSDKRRRSRPEEATFFFVKVAAFWRCDGTVA